MVLQQRSAHDDVSGPDPGLHLRTGRGEHVVESRGDGVRDFGEDIVMQSVHDAVDRYSQAIHPSEGDHRESVSIKVSAKTLNVAVPGKHLKAHAYLLVG